MKIELITPPSSLPIDLSKIKSFMRIIGDEDDATITQMLLASINRAEMLTNRQLGGVATFALYLDKMPSYSKIKLPKSPLVEVVSVKYIDADEAEQTLDASEYWIDSKATPAELTFVNSAKATSPKPNAVTITFKGGYEKIPSEIVSWLSIMTSTMYEHRERFVVGASVAEFSNDYIDGLLDSLRIVPI